MHEFVGRDRELALLTKQLDRVVAGGRAGGPGRALLMRGRRRVGKSRLTEEFIHRAGVPHLFFTASAQPTVEADLQLFVEAAQHSNLPGAGVFADQTPKTWDAAMRLLAAAVPPDRPSVVVLDEMPYLIGTDPGFEGTLQKVFDRELSRLPVLLICIGSDLAMMEALNEYGRPFHQRATELVVPPLSPADVADMLDLPAAEAIDAYLVCGGLPLVLDEWPRGAPVMDYLGEAVMEPTSALLVSGERALAAEFPGDSQARRCFLFVPVLTRAGAAGRGDLTLARIETSWTSWRGRAVEPVVRECLRRLPDGFQPPGTGTVGGYWTRTNDPEIDIVGADREPIAKQITCVGSIKWLENRPFDAQDLGHLLHHRAQLPGADTETPLVAVSRNGAATQGVPVLRPEDLLTAYR